MSSPTLMKAEQAWSVSYPVADDGTSYLSEKVTLTAVLLSLTCSNYYKMPFVLFKDFSFVSFELAAFPP
jgi:hypothetical protein